MMNGKVGRKNPIIAPTVPIRYLPTHERKGWISFVILGEVETLAYLDNGCVNRIEFKRGFAFGDTFHIDARNLFFGCLDTLNKNVRPGEATSPFAVGCDFSLDQQAAVYCEHNTDLKKEHRPLRRSFPSCHLLEVKSLVNFLLFSL